MVEEVKACLAEYVVVEGDARPARRVREEAAQADAKRAQPE